jgi:ribosomal protein S18 acetylase RimI-like enzyme
MIRPITPNDAAAFLTLQRQLDAETQYMSFGPDERQIGEKEQRARLQRVLKQPNSIILVADNENELVGYCAAYGGKQARNQHRAGITVAVLERFHRRGIATRLLSRLEDWARDARIKRLELTVMETNFAAICFYLSVGFHVEGRRNGSIYMPEHGYIAELYIGKMQPWSAA